MISKRNKRPARPQENLRQFALNNSKGVDSTKAPTDFDTISRSNNLVVNPDGSLSLRKPIEYVENTERDAGVEQYYLYDGTSKLIRTGNVFSIESSDGKRQRVKAVCPRYDGTLAYKYYYDTIDDLIFPDGALRVINLNSTTVLGNCNVNLEAFSKSILDESLYDAILPTPRYVHVRYDESKTEWVLDIKSPEVNTITNVDGEIALNPNTTLDSAYAIRDSYKQSVPSCKGILAYAPSRRVGNKVTYNEFTVPSTVDEKFGFTDFYRTVSNRDSIKDSFSTTPSSVDVVSDTGDTNIRVTLTHVIDPETSTIVQKVSVKLLDSDNYSAQAEVFIRLDSQFNLKRANGNSESHWFDDSSVDTYVTSEMYTDEGSAKHLGVRYFTSNQLLDIESIWRVYVRISFIGANAETVTVAQLTESTKEYSYRPLVSVKEITPDVVLKAFCNLPVKNASETYYASWFKSTDGIHWDQLSTFVRTDGILVRELDPTWRPSENVEDKDQVKDYIERYYYPIYGESPQDEAYRLELESANFRIDAVRSSLETESANGQMYRFKIIAVEEISETAPEWDSEKTDTAQYRVYATVSQADYVPVFSPEFVFLYSEFGNTVYGNKLYHKKSIYSYGSEKFFNNIFVSDIDSFITPLYNVIDLDTHSAAQASCIVPWRDYLVSATNNAIYLHTRATDGFLTKTVNTSIGISEQDSRCCKAVLNGILFKSGPKIYQLYPNLYSGDDSTLNLTEISRAVEDYLEGYTVEDDLPFAFSTESEYVLMLPNAEDTTCLRYDYSSKLWTVCTYPIVATDYKIINIDDIRIFGKFGEKSAEFKFDSSVKTDVYGDIMPDGIVPIEFEWDTGQKTDNISIAKQFVESKIVFATEDLIEAFPMELTVAIDGDPHVTVLDVNSDAPFWKTDDSKGVLNTALRLGNSESSGVLRQLIVRYSGKGRSVRHILSGSPTSNFRLYETYVRYKTLNIKR